MADSNWFVLRSSTRFDLEPDQFQTVWADNSDSTVNTNWGVDVQAAYNGLTASGQFNASVKSTSQYSTFSNLMQKTVSCAGGNSTLAQMIVSAPTNETVYNTFSQWVGSSLTSPDVMSFQLLELWTIMSAAPDPTVQKRAPDVLSAYSWIVSSVIVLYIHLSD